MKIKSFILSFVVLFSSLALGDEGSCEYFLGTFNAFKFIHDKKFLPDKAAEDSKLHNTAQLVSAMNNGQGPDLMAFVETDNEFLDALVKHPQIANLNIMNHGTAPEGDDRGNNLGLISRFPLSEKPIVHTYWKEEDPIWNFRKGFGRKDFSKGLLTRPIMEYRLSLPNKEELIVFVNHWPSKKLGDWSALQRFQAGEYLKKVTDQILDKNPDANIMILGDFNANPDGPEMKVAMKVANDGRLINLEEWHFNLRTEIKAFKEANPKANRHDVERHVKALLKQRGSYYYQHDNSWEMFDQIIISRNVLKYLVKDSFGPVRDNRFITTDGHPMSFTTKYNRGASDHFPVGVRLKVPGSF